MGDLLTVISDDVGDVFLIDYAVTITIDGNSAQAIPLDDFASSDPRAPRLRVASADIDGIAQGTAVIYNGASYTIESILPGRFGLSDVLLTAL